MPIYRNSDKLVLFVHIPKCGGSTVEEVIKSSGASQAFKYHKRLGYSNSTPQHMHWEVIRRWIPRSFYDYAFTVVRHPFARLVSEYRWRRTLVESGLPDFDNWVNNQLNRYSKCAYILDNHMRRQVEFCGPAVELFRMEDGLEAPIGAALDVLKLPKDKVPIHHARKSEQHPPETIKAGTLERVTRFYELDFETFGYNPNDLPESLRLAIPSV